MVVLKRTVVLALFISLLCVSSIAYLAYQQAVGTTEQRERDELNGLVVQVANRLDRSAQNALISAEIIANEPPALAALKSGDRDTLLALTRDAYARVQERSGGTTGHFHTADLHSFLRIQSPKQFGEYLGDSRPMVVAANRTRQAQSGIEIGATGAAIRGVAPVGAGDNFAGTFEIGVDLGTIVQPLKTDTNADFAILVFKNSLPSASAQPGGATHDYGDLTGVAATNWDVMGQLAAGPAAFIGKEPRFGAASLGGTPYGFVVIPLLDFSGRTVGSVVGAVDLRADYSSLRRQAAVLAGSVVVSMVVIGGVFLIIVNGFILLPLRAATKAAGRLAHGEHLGDLPTAARGDDAGHLLNYLHDIDRRLKAVGGDAAVGAGDGLGELLAPGVEEAGEELAGWEVIAEGDSELEKTVEVTG